MPGHQETQEKDSDQHQPSVGVASSAPTLDSLALNHNHDQKQEIQEDHDHQFETFLSSQYLLLRENTIHKHKTKRKSNGHTRRASSSTE